MASLRVVYEYTSVPAREVDRRLRKVYTLLSRAAPLRPEDSVARAGASCRKSLQEVTDEGCPVYEGLYCSSGAG